MMKLTCLGQGAFSKVYLGTRNDDSSEEVAIAIKVVDRTKLCEEEQDRLMAEVLILRMISSHQNILSELICV